MEQRIRFADVMDRRIAWAEVGSGPTVVIPSPWIGNLHTFWEDPQYRGFVERLASRHRVISYDRPGTGLSERKLPDDPSLDFDVGVLEQLLTQVAPGPISIFALSAGSCIALGFAARNPGLVSAMALIGSYADGEQVASKAVRESLVAVIRASWGLGAKMLSDIMVPDASPEEREAWTRLQRDSADAEAAAELYAQVYSYDATRAVPHATAPTLVMHRRDDTAVRFELGRELASELPNARFLPLEGTRHLPWQGDSEVVLEETLAFLAEHAGDDEADGPRLVADLESATGGPPEAQGLAGPIVLPDLSPRELEVLRLIADGLSDREISERLTLSQHTVHRHVANIRTKLRQPSRAAAAAQAVRLKLI